MQEHEVTTDEKTDAITLAAELTAAWLGNPNTRAEPDAVPAFLKTMHAELVRLESTGADHGSGTIPAEQEFAPATTARKSLSSRDHIISMIDGKPYRSLGRHIAAHGLTPDAYRARYNLKSDYPMVSPGYSEQRRAIAVRLGLGRKPATPAPEPDAEAAPAPRRKLGVTTPA